MYNRQTNCKEAIKLSLYLIRILHYYKTKFFYLFFKYKYFVLCHFLLGLYILKSNIMLLDGIAKSLFSMNIIEIDYDYEKVISCFRGHELKLVFYFNLKVYCRYTGGESIVLVLSVFPCSV